MSTPLPHDSWAEAQEEEEKEGREDQEHLVNCLFFACTQVIFGNWWTALPCWSAATGWFGGSQKGWVWEKGEILLLCCFCLVFVTVFVIVVVVIVLLGLLDSG
jgi:hypothetical protein